MDLDGFSDDFYITTDRKVLNEMYIYNCFTNLLLRPKANDSNLRPKRWMIDPLDPVLRIGETRSRRSVETSQVSFWISYRDDTFTLWYGTQMLSRTTYHSFLNKLIVYKELRDKIRSVKSSIVNCRSSRWRPYVENKTKLLICVLDKNNDVLSNIIYNTPWTKWVNVVERYIIL